MPSCMPVIPALLSHRQKSLEFEASLGYTKYCFRKEERKNERKEGSKKSKEKRKKELKLLNPIK